MIKAPAKNSHYWIPKPWTVTESLQENSNTVTLTIEPREGGPGLYPQPGQFNMLYAYPVGEIPISFSAISGKNVRHTIRGLGAVSRALCKTRVGDTLGVRGPFGRGWCDQIPAQETVLLIAGGLGIAPLKPLIERMIEEKSNSRRIILFYGARRPDDLIFKNELQTWQEKIDVILSVDHGDKHWTGHVGVIPNLLRLIHFDPAHTLAFMCGPEIMMRYSVDTLCQLGLTAERQFLSMERNMKCAIAQCGHCQYGSHLLCRDGPVFCYQDIANYLTVKEL